jgi:SAM-dependent methyltransferase
MPNRVINWLHKMPALPNVIREHFHDSERTQKTSGVAQTNQYHLFNVLAQHGQAPLLAVAPVAAHIDPTPWINLANLQMEFTLEEYAQRDLLPLPSANNREGYHGERHYDYWLSGLKDYLQIKQVLHRHNIPFTPMRRMFELGCATGRVLRHFVCQEPQLEVWGADINLSHIEWVLQFLGSSPKVFQSSVLPYLPLEDNSMDLVTAFSVFTHINEFELAWLAEVRRILRPGGVAYITLHTDQTWSILNHEYALYNHLLYLQPYILEYDISPELFAKPMPTPRVAFRWEMDGFRSANLFHSHAYLQATWGRFFKILEIIHKGSDYQDVVLLQKI